MLLAAHAIPFPASGQVFMEQAYMDPNGPRFQAGGYGVISYFHFNWDTDPNRRPAIDLERLVLGAGYRLTPEIELKGELEVEHGGTGVTVEFDPFEEFGEFETEVEKGGEIVLEELHATFNLGPGLRIRAGHFYVPVGFLSSKYLPSEYLTVTRPDAETVLVPAQWDETGVKLMGRQGPLRFQVGVVNGLDNSAFSSANWVQPGHQRRFEQIRVANVAVIGRLDVLVGPGFLVGASGYLGNSTGNRPKPDLDVPAYVTIVDAHADLSRGPLRARSLFLYGHLQNSGAVSEANRRLSNNLNVKRTPVASAALGWYMEAGYNVLPFFARTDSVGRRPRREVIPFAAYQFYDSMYRTAAEIFDNPRWEREQVILGVDVRLHPQLVLKSQYAWRTVGLSTDNREDTFSAGIGAEF